MTDEELAAIEARANAATRGPWKTITGGPFISVSKDIPELVAEVRRLREELLAAHKREIRIAQASAMALDLVDIKSGIARLKP